MSAACIENLGRRHGRRPDVARRRHQRLRAVHEGPHRRRAGHRHAATSSPAGRNGRAAAGTRHRPGDRHRGREPQARPARSNCARPATIVLYRPSGEVAELRGPVARCERGRQAGPCANGKDDDGDGMIDDHFADGATDPDPGCTSTTDTSENSEIAGSGGLRDPARPVGRHRRSTRARRTRAAARSRASGTTRPARSPTAATAPARAPCCQCQKVGETGGTMFAATHPGPGRDRRDREGRRLPPDDARADQGRQLRLVLPREARRLLTRQVDRPPGLPPRARGRLDRARARDDHVTPVAIGVGLVGGVELDGDRAGRAGVVDRRVLRGAQRGAGRLLDLLAGAGGGEVTGAEAAEPGLDRERLEPGAEQRAPTPRRPRRRR